MRYFAANESQIQWYAERLNPYDADFAPTPIVCDSCGRIGPCIRYSPDSILEKLGCLSCLRKGAFFYYHDTEVGRMVPGYQFQRHVGNPFQGTTQVVYDGLPPDFSEAAFDELLRTPPYRFLQHEQWLLHCNDFMIALGRWTANDLRSHSGGQNPEAFLHSLLDSDHHSPHTVNDLEMGMWLNAFQCPQCGTLRATYEW